MTRRKSSATKSWVWPSVRHLTRRVPRSMPRSSSRRPSVSSLSTLKPGDCLPVAFVQLSRPDLAFEMTRELELLSVERPFARRGCLLSMESEQRHQKTKKRHSSPAGQSPLLVRCLSADRNPTDSAQLTTYSTYSSAGR